MAGSRNHAALTRRLWRRARRAALERDAWTCQTCGKFGNECHHIQPLDHGGKPYALDNLTILCRGCHIQLTREQNTRPDPGRDGWRALVSERMAEP